MLPDNTSLVNLRPLGEGESPGRLRIDLCGMHGLGIQCATSSLYKVELQLESNLLLDVNFFMFRMLVSRYCSRPAARLVIGTFYFLSTKVFS